MLFNTCIIENWTVCQSASNLKSKSKQIFCHIFWFRPKTWITKSSISKINFSGRHENSYFSVSLISFNLSWIRRVRRWVQPIFSRGSLAFSPSPRSRSHKYFYGFHWQTFRFEAADRFFCSQSLFHLKSQSRVYHYCSCSKFLDQKFFALGEPSTPRIETSEQSTKLTIFVFVSTFCHYYFCLFLFTSDQHLIA